ncbi:uncharacterized protein LOC132474935 isoform X2 [Gadus macrocephalus]|uniref:uncharacterized protein LOC132474935 isoform X2 n=1 Tax=Gadus macrocephalus TaxID=80720 RepID=UPI0028CB2AD4|nr:uncharacterized protein LOC132474935 isoform X2 [Gadus macrocephalus]
MEPKKQQKPAASKRSAGRGGTSNIVLPVVRYHPSITQTSHQGRGPSSAQKIFPARKPDKKPDQKPDQKLDQKPDQKPDQRPDQRPEKKTDKRPDKKPDQRQDKKPDLVLGGRSDVLEQPFLNYGSGCKMGRNPAGGSNGQNSLKTLSSGPSPEKVVLEGGELTPGVVEEVEVLTRGQRDNPAWFEWRKHRITASNVHRIAHSRFVNGTSSTPPGSYVANITGQGSRVQTRAMRWGVDMEARAVKEYQVLKSKLLGREVVVQDSGLFIDPKRPWLAASPDGIVIDKLSGQRMLCLEVKCPFKHKDRKVEEACKEDKDFCLQIQELPNQPVYRLKKNHSYYSQIQCQLAVTGMDQADLAVFTLKETALVPVPFDPEFWEETLSKLQRFKEVLLPQLEKHRPLDPEMRPEM